MASEKSGESLLGILLLQLACLIVLAFSFWLAISAHSSLPHTYPLLVTLSGTFIGWVTKSWFSVLWLPLIQSGMFLLMAGLSFWIAFSRRSLTYLSQPVDTTEPPDVEMSKVRWRAAYDGSQFSLLTLLATAYLNYIILHSEIMRAAPSRGLVLFIGIVLVFCVSAEAGWVALVVRKDQDGPLWS